MQSMYYIALDVHKKTISYWRNLKDFFPAFLPSASGESLPMLDTDLSWTSPNRKLTVTVHWPSRAFLI